MSFIQTIFGKVLPCMLALHVLEVQSAFPDAPQSQYKYGRVSMHGSIIDTPCAISTADLFQSVEMGDTSLGEIILNGGGQKKTFSLNLVNCDLISRGEASSDGTYFRTTFDGPSAEGLFIVSGAQGVALQISDSAGNVALPGQQLPARQLTPGIQRLDYSLRLVGNNATLKVGDYHAVLRFKVDYL